MDIKGHERTLGVLNSEFSGAVIELTPEPTDYHPNIRYVRAIVGWKGVQPHNILNVLNVANLTLRHGQVPEGNEPKFVHVSSTPYEQVPGGHNYVAVTLEDTATQQV